MNSDQELDTSGLNCPMPVLKAKKAVREMQSGEILHLIATDPGSRDDIPTFASRTHCKLLESNEDSGKFHFFIQKD